VIIFSSITDIDIDQRLEISRKKVEVFCLDLLIASPELPVNNRWSLSLGAVKGRFGSSILDQFAHQKKSDPVPHARSLLSRYWSQGLRVTAFELAHGVFDLGGRNGIESDTLHHTKYFRLHSSVRAIQNAAAGPQKVSWRKRTAGL